MISKSECGISLTREGIVDTLDLWLRMIGRGEWVLKLEKMVSKRSVSQNALLWLWMTACSQWWYESTGVRYTKEQFKEYFARLFIPVTGPDGETIGRSTSELTTEEMTRFLDEIRLHVSESDEWDHLQLPLPEEKMFDEWRSQYE